MPPMLVPQEVDAEAHLRAFADGEAAAAARADFTRLVETTAFPFPPGAAIRLAPETADIFGVAEGTPALVLARVEQSPMGLVGFCARDGNVRTATVTAMQVATETPAPA